MNILQNRIDSFKNNLVKWPYEKDNKYPKPASFAKAGFYFARRPKASDSVRCFVCDIEISHWRPNQSPFVRHGVESPHCAWKLLNFPDAHKVSLNTSYKANGGPRSPAMRAARLATFNSHNYWPPKKGVSNYTTAVKLAGAGFFFSPTATKPSRVKCAYCGTTMDSPSANLDLLNEHHKLNSKCIFFEHTPNTRRSSRKDTMDSAGSNNTFRTAESSLKNDESSDDGSPSKRRITKASSSSDTNSNKLSSKRQRTSSDDETDTSELMPVVVIEKIPVSGPEPFTKARRTKVAASSPKKLSTSATKTEPEKSTTSSAKISSKKVDVTQTTVNKEASVWDIEHAFKPRRPIITFGSSRHTHRPLTTRHTTPSINILPNLESSLIIKSSNELKQSTALKQTTISESSKNINERNKIVQPVTSRVFERRTKSNITKLPSTDHVSSSTKRRSLSTTRTSDTEAAGPSKRLRLKVVVDKVNIDEQNTFSKPESRKDKGKGRAVEYNFTPQPSPKKPVSLSRSQGRQSTASSQSSSSSNALFNDNSNANVPEQKWYDPIVNMGSQSNYEGPLRIAPSVNATVKPLTQPSNTAASNQCFSSDFTGLPVPQPSSSYVPQSSSSSDVAQSSTSPVPQETKETISSPPTKSIKEASPSSSYQNNKEESPFSPAKEGEKVSSLSVTQDLEELSLFTVTQEPASPVQQQQQQQHQPTTHSPQMSLHKLNSPSPNYSTTPTATNQSRTPSPFHKPIVHSPEREDQPGFPMYEPTVKQEPEPVPYSKPLVYSPERTPVYRRSNIYNADNLASFNIQEDDEAGGKIDYEEFSGLNLASSVIADDNNTGVSDMEFMQSTPTRSSNRMAKAFDILGDTLFSPIRPSAQTNEFQYTPIITEGRIRNAIANDPEGTLRMVEHVQKKKEEEEQTSSSITDNLARSRAMTVEQHYLSLVETSIEKIEQESIEKIRMIEEKFESIRSEISKE